MAAAAEREAPVLAPRAAKVFLFLLLRGRLGPRFFATSAPPLPPSLKLPVADKVDASSDEGEEDASGEVNPLP
jgi:hypothetical protein